MLIDTHAHLNFKDFKKDRDKVINRCLDNNVWLINVGTNYESSKQVIKIAEKYQQGVFSAVGLHPINIAQISNLKTQNHNSKLKTKKNEDILEEDFDYERYKDLGKSNKVVAIGEIGLDYWSKPKTKRKLELFKKKQKEIFLKQLKLARESNLPVIFHCRKAHDDLLKILNNNLTIKPFKHLAGVIHCFTGSWDQAEKYLEMGFHLGFNGIIFKLDLNKIIKKTPLNRVLIETDCPFLAPPGFPEKRNNPLGVKLIAEYIAKVRGVTFEEIAEITTENAIKLFKLL